MITKKTLPRGIRNNNPGNLRIGSPWQGLDNPADDGEFCRFVSPVMGIRAMACTLITYQDRRKAKDGSAIDTVYEIIERWAPGNENNTKAYAESIRRALKVNPGQHLDMHDYETLSSLVKAMIQHENGVNPYSDKQIQSGLARAGVLPDETTQPLKQSRTIKAAQAAGGATALGLVAEHSDEIKTLVFPNLHFIIDFIQKVPFWVWGAIALVAIGGVIYARWDDHRTGRK